MAREMLLVNESPLQRKIVSSYVMSELDDVVLETAASPEEGLEMISRQKYDVVVSAVKTEGDPGLDIFRQLRDSALNGQTPFVAMALRDAPDLRARLAAEGVENFLFAPYTAESLALVVNQACDPRGLRRAKRYNIPGAEAVFRTGERTMGIAIVNISLNGLLGEYRYEDGFTAYWSPGFLDVKFPEELGGAEVQNIQAAACRVDVIAWRADREPDLLRVAWSYLETPDAAEELLDEVFEKVDRQSLTNGDPPEGQG